MKRYIATLLLLAICASTQAREVFPLNEGWRFFFKSENSSDNARHVTLPHTWNTDTGGTGYFLETTANYQNDMYIPAEWATKRLFVKFYGVQSVADVFVNGYHVGEHRAQPGEPVGGAVLQRYCAGLGALNGGQRGAAKVLLGQKRHSGHAARQRDYIVARSGGEQVAHGRRAHLAHASGDLVAGGVEGDVS